MRWVVVIAVLALAGCASSPAQPTEADYDVIVQQRNDWVWQQTGLDDRARPEVVAGKPTGQLDAGKAFAACMAERSWPDYQSSDIGYGYRAIQLATSDAERLDWYECFAAHPVDSQYTFGSEAQFDLVYDYYQDTLIPCLQENGYTITKAPTREEFRTTWLGWSDPLFPFVWNPYYPLQKHGAVDTTALEAICPPEPPNQDFYAFDD